MSWRFTDLPYRKRLEPEELKVWLLRTLEDVDGSVSDMSEHLGMSRRILYKYFHDLGIFEQTQLIRDKYREARRRGRPAKKQYGHQDEFDRMLKEEPTQLTDALTWVAKDAHGNFGDMAKILGVSKKRLASLISAVGFDLSSASAAQSAS